MAGHILLLRHAVTEPGLGDPQNFVLGDCATQRNLSAAGRVQARALGQWLRTQGIPVGEVRSSQWCRCLDTARLAFAPELEIQPWPALNSSAIAGVSRSSALKSCRACPAHGSEPGVGDASGQYHPR